MNTPHEPNENPTHQNMAHTNHVPVIPNYFEERAKLDRDIQQGIRSFNLSDATFIPAFLTFWLPFTMVMMGLTLFKYERGGGEIPVNRLTIIAMVCVGGFYSITYLFKMMMKFVHNAKSFFFHTDDEEYVSSENYSELYTPENIEDRISTILQLQGAPSFEQYKDSGKYENKHWDYVRIVTSYSSIKRICILTVINSSLCIMLPPLFMNLFVGHHTSNLFLAALFTIFFVAFIMYYKSCKEYSQFFYENAHIASYSLIEYSIYKSLWSQRSKNI